MLTKENMIEKKGKYTIKISSATDKILNLYLYYIVSTLKKQRINFSFVRLPIKRKVLTLYKSPHVHKKAKSQYEFRKHRISIFIEESSRRNSIFLQEVLFINKPKSILLKVIHEK